METITTTATDYVNILKEYTVSGEKKSQWEQYFLQPLQEQTSANVQNIKQQTDYDISSAYANYKKSALNVAQNSQLGTGFKQQTKSNLKDIYSQQYGAEKTEQAEGISKELTVASEALAEENKRLQKLGEVYSKIDVATQDYLMSKGYNVTKMYDTDETGKQTQTKYGSALYQETMYNDPEYLKYLKENDLYEDYAENRGALNKYMAGLDESTWESTDEAKEIIKAQTLKDQLSEVVKLEENATLQDYQKEILTQGKLNNKLEPTKITIGDASYDVERIATSNTKEKDLYTIAKGKNVNDIFEYNNEVYKVLIDFSKTPGVLNSQTIHLIKIKK